MCPVSQDISRRHGQFTAVEALSWRVLNSSPANARNFLLWPEGNVRDGEDRVCLLVLYTRMAILAAVVRLCTNRAVNSSIVT